MQGHFLLKCIHYFNSLNTKKQATHFSAAKKKKKKKTSTPIHIPNSETGGQIV